MVVDFSLSAEQEELRTRVRSIALEELRPLASEADVSGRLPDSAEKVLAAAHLPGAEGFASGDADPLSFCLTAEAISWGDAAFGFGWVASRQVAWLIAACGTAEQKRRYLPGLAASPLAPASLFLFEGFGRGPSELQTLARRDGDEWVVSGNKIAVAFAGEGRPAVIVARDEAGELIGFVTDDLGDRVTFDGHDEPRVALESLSLANSAVIDDLRLGPEAVLDRDGLGAAVSVCRLAQSSVLLGSAEAATRYAADWGKERTAFGRPLVGFQGVSFVLADLFMEIESVRARVADAATRSAEEDISELTAHIAAHANILLRDAAREGVELMGVHGIIAEHPNARVFRSAAVLTGIDFDPLAEPLKLTC